MKLSKKHILLGSICLTSAILSNVPVVCAIIPYLAFCLCSFALMNGKKAIGTVTVLLIGFVGLPLFKFVYSMLTVSFMTTPIANVLVLLVHTVVYFVFFMQNAGVLIAVPTYLIYIITTKRSPVQTCILYKRTHL